MAKLKGTRPKSSASRLKSTAGFTSGRGSNYKGGYSAATDVKTGYGRNSAGQYDSEARVGSKAGRGGKMISHRQRYYDMRLAFGFAGG